ncbi:sterol desaturase family protein [Nannocystis sp. SCPEA4]|uniref:sterol desaturase family protein n=1 Tax=Nannocystis sp. SCPEA4 TaxID=2996787 RepID=UPI00226F3135|nr:sterol desaturase family protein [Nannocystis sp. SCPEA4]MCY1057504.1 sterol desaturase family protein [Nannocystis sp. SCPEA4]
MLRLLACPQHGLVFATLLIGEASLCALASATPCAAFVGAWLLGLALWTLLEYLLHRFAFHLPPTHPLALFGARQHFDHHAAPERTPITKPLVLTAPALLAGHAAVSWLTGSSLVAPLWAGLVAGYLGYEVMHVAAHALAPEEHPLPSFQRAHLDHHVDIRSNFGITSPLWDVLLGTRRR